MAEERNLEGLGGWLIFIGLAIVISPLRILAQVLPVYLKVFSNGSWTTLTTPGTEAYNPLWSPIILGEIAINGGLLVAWILAAFLFFKRSTTFPKYYIGLLLFTPTFILLDTLAIKMVLPEESLFDAETTKELVRSFVGAIIWVPYMLVSKRVKATFIKKETCPERSSGGGPPDQNGP